MSGEGLISVRYILATSAALAAVLPFAPAMGQQAVESHRSSLADAQAAAAPTSDQRDHGKVADIIVTANRRAERNQDVPIAITAMSAERLQQQNITQPQDLQGSVPSLSVSATGQVSREVQIFTLRGQGATFQASPGVVAYFNEVPLPSPVTLSQQGGPGNLIDLENLQILAGPQGTLFGRNTTGGAVLLVPKKPTNDFGGYVQGTIGNYKDRELEGVINVPIVADKIMIRAVGSFKDRDGYTRDIVWNKDRDDVHYYTGRLGILLRPNDSFESYFLAYGAKSNTNGAGNVHSVFNIAALKAIPGFCSDPDCSVYARADAIAQSLGKRKTMSSIDTFQNTSTWGIENTSRLDLSDDLSLRNIISYQRFKSSYLYDGDGTPLQQYDVGVSEIPGFPVSVSAGGNSIGPFYYANQSPVLPRDDFHTITEELQLQGDAADKRITYTLGGFLFDQKPKQNQGQYQVSYCPDGYTGYCPYAITLNGVRTRSKALYAQATIDLGVLTPRLDGLRITGGYRYTWDHITGFNISYTANANDTFTCASPVVPGTVTNSDGSVNAPSDCRFTGNLKSSSPSWTLGADYRVSQQALLFAKISRGYKSGGFNSYAVRESTRIFMPEKVLTYEFGAKTDFRIGAVPARLNASYYHTDYSNVQRAAGDQNGVFAGAQILPAKARIKGVEVEASIAPASWLGIGGNFSHMDAKYVDFSYTAIAPTLSCDGTITQAGGTVDLNCLPFQYAPRYTYSVHADISIPTPAELGQLSLFVNLAHSSHQHSSPLSLPPTEPFERLPANTLLNASINIKKIGGSGFDVGLFVTNALNKVFRISNTGTYNALLTQAALYSEPRMYGLRVRANF